MTVNGVRSLVWVAGYDGPALQSSDGDRPYLECYICGDHPIEADDDGLYYEIPPVPCTTCGSWVWVSVDDRTASLDSSELVADIGQPPCDGSCERCGGELPDGDFEGVLCDWECPRAAAAAEALTEEALREMCDDP